MTDTFIDGLAMGAVGVLAAQGIWKAIRAYLGDKSNTPTLAQEIVTSMADDPSSWSFTSHSEGKLWDVTNEQLGIKLRVKRNAYMGEPQPADDWPINWMKKDHFIKNALVGFFGRDNQVHWFSNRDGVIVRGQIAQLLEDQVILGFSFDPLEAKELMPQQ